MSFESPSGVPAPEDATPLTPPPAYPPPAQPGQGQQYPYQNAPQYGGAPYPQAPYPQYGGPYNGSAVPQPGARPSAALSIAVIALAGLYVVLCLVEIFALNSRVSLANKLIDDPTSVSIDQVNSADNLVSGLSVVALVVFIAVIIVLAVWRRSLSSALSPIGKYQEVLRVARYQLFRAVWLVSILLAVVLRGSGNVDTAQDVVSHDHQYMAYYGIRAALGLLLVFLALRLKRVSDAAFTQALSTAGYGAGGPVYPGG